MVVCYYRRLPIVTREDGKPVVPWQPRDDFLDAARWLGTLHTRALEVAVYAPIGVAAYVREMGPDVVRTVVARGRAEVEVRQEQVANGLRHAKGAGEVAIAFGLPVLRRRMEARLSSMRPTAR